MRWEDQGRVEDDGGGGMVPADFDVGEGAPEIHGEPVQDNNDGDQDSGA